MGIIGDSSPIAETLHGTDVLGEHYGRQGAGSGRQKAAPLPADVDESDLDDFFRRVIERAVLAAMQFGFARGRRVLNLRL